MRDVNWKAFGLLSLGFAVGWWASHPSALPLQAVHAGSAGSGAHSEVVAFASDSPGGGQILYLIDPKQKVLSVYDFDARKAKLKLAAVRQYAADHQLAEYNNERPTVADIEQLVRPK